MYKNASNHIDEFPSYITEFVGHYASLNEWNDHLKYFPFEKIMTGWKEIKKSTISEKIQSLSLSERMASLAPPKWNSIKSFLQKEDYFLGMEGILLNTKISDLGSEWNGEWPRPIPGERCTIKNADDFFSEKIINISNFHIYKIKNALSLEVVVQCNFSNQGYLKNIAFIKMHEWKPLNKKIENVKEQKVQNEKKMVELSDAGSLAQISGWYEAILPDDHPMQKYFSKSDIRFVFRNKGEKFPKLGVTPASDEDLVKWLWLREDR